MTTWGHNSRDTSNWFPSRRRADRDLRQFGRWQISLGQSAGRLAETGQSRDRSRQHLSVQ